MHQADAEENGGGDCLTGGEKKEFAELRRRNRLLEQESEILRRAAARAGECPPKVIFPLVRELADDGVPVAVACRVLNISRSGFCDWLGRPEPLRELRNRELMKIIREIHAGSRGSYGSPRVHAELRLGKGMQVNRKRVERLMREAGLQGIYRRKGRRNLVNAATEEDLVGRQFTAEAPDRLWLTDITEHPAAGGKLYFSVTWNQRPRVAPA
jgi:hypothetical protein